MNPKALEVKETEVYQWPAEQIPYTLDVTNYGSSPTSPSMTIVDADGNDVTSTLAPSGSPSVSSNVITWPVITGGTSGQTYTVTFTFTISGTVFTPKMTLIFR